MKNLNTIQRKALQNKYLPALLIGVLLSFFAQGQTIDTSRVILPVNGSGFQYKILKSDSASLFPKDTLHLKYDWRGIGFKGDNPYYWNGKAWKSFGSVGNSRNGIRLSGDTTILGDSLDRYTYIQVLASQREGSLYHQLRLGNRTKAQSLNGNIPDLIYKSTYGPALFYVEQLFSTQNNDIDSSFYNAASIFYTGTLRDSTDTEYKIGGRTEYMPNGGVYALNQYFPPRDSNIVRVGRDGQSGNSVFAQLDWGNYFGYKSNIINPTDLPDFPISNIRSSIDLVRNIDNTRTKKMYGVGVTGYNAMYKSYQTPITMSTYQAGNYWGRMIDYTAYGDAYPLISGATKAYTLGVAEVNQSIGFYARPHYLYTNTVRDGYGFVARGDSDYNHLPWLSIGPYSTLPSRANGGNNSWADRVYVNGNIRATGNTYAFVTQAYGMAVNIPIAVGTEAGINFTQTDSVVTGTVAAYLSPSNRDGRGMYIREEGFTAAVYPDNSPGGFVQIETGANHANLTRWGRNGNLAVGYGVNTIPYRLYKKLMVNGGSVFSLNPTDTMTLKYMPQAWNDSTRYKKVVWDNTNGNLLIGYESPAGGGGGGGTLTNVATGFGLTGGPITTTGTISGDTTVGVGLLAYPRYLKFKDSVNSIFTPMARSISTGYGLTGGGDFSTNRTHVFDSATVFPQIRTSIFANIADKQIAYSNAGVLSGSSQLKFTGQTLQLASTNTTQSTTSSIFSTDANALTTGTGHYIASSTLTSGNLINLVSTSTAKTGANTLLNINSSGTNAASSIVNRGATISVTNAGTTSENRGIELTASGATTNWAAYATAGNFRTVGAAGYYALNSGGTGGVSMTYDNGTIATLGSTGGVRLDLEAAGSTILARRPFIVGIGIDMGNNVALDVYKSSSGTSNIQNWRSSGGSVLANVDQSGVLNLGSAGATIGKYTQSGNTSGTITFQPQAAAGTYNMNWPTTAGSSGQALLSAGGGSSAMTWLDLAGAATNPTITGVANVASSSSPVIQYTRAGSRVSLSGYVNITPTAGSTKTTFRVSLPIASNFVSATEAPGSAAAADGTTFAAGSVIADATNDELQVSFTSINTSAHTVTFSATYVIQ